jgi:mono/diheme cytochrome c family protein
MMWFGGCATVFGALTPEQIAQLPPAANHPVDFAKDIKPIFEESCIKCHGHGRDKGGLRIDTRETLLKGGDSGAAVVLGKSADSYLIQLVQGFDPDETMPKKGKKLTPEQIGLMRAWIDQGLKWDPHVFFGRVEPPNLKPLHPMIPAGPTDANPIDLFLQPYFAAHGIKPGKPVNDRVFARRVYLDVIGLLPPPQKLEAFVADKHKDKRERLVKELLADNSDYAQKWMTFWNDALRNDYRGTGYIDGGREQITGWLYSSLATNMAYNEFVSELINPVQASEGFIKGIVWRGAVNASQTPQMQAAQNISQVFMGVNLKCASCHDSFINDLTLADAYGLAGIYASNALEMVHCDKPTGQKAALRFIYPELGTIDPKADRATRLKRLAEIITERDDARLTSTIVNRFWQRFMGHGLVDPVDDMEKPGWNPDLLAWMADDLAEHHYDLKHLIEQILTAKAYQMPAVSTDEKSGESYVFRGPMVRRMSAEEYRDALAELTGVWYEQPASQVDFTAGRDEKPLAAPFGARWIWNDPKAAEAAPPGTVYFRKTFRIEEMPSEPLIFIAADNSFTLYLNGKKVGTGNDYSQLKRIDLRGKLAKGRNTIAVSAVNGGDGPNPAGMFVYAYLRKNPKSKAEKIMDFGTDKSWAWTTTKAAGWEKEDFDAAGWQAASELGGVGMGPWNMQKQFQMALAAPEEFGKVRAVLANADSLQVALGRPNRDQVVTTRLSEATTLEALELTNGKELADLIKRGAQNVMAETHSSSNELIPKLYDKALGRKPTSDEMKLAQAMVGQPAQPAGVEDLMWALTMLPEFQLIY